MEENPGKSWRWAWGLLLALLVLAAAGGWLWWRQGQTSHSVTIDKPGEVQPLAVTGVPQLQTEALQLKVESQVAGYG